MRKLLRGGKLIPCAQQPANIDLVGGGSGRIYFFGVNRLWEKVWQADNHFDKIVKTNPVCFDFQEQFCINLRFGTSIGSIDCSSTGTERGQP